MATSLGNDGLVLWHTVKQHIFHAGPDTDDVFARCSICHHAHLDIWGLPDVSGGEFDTRPGVVLPCGHMFCKPCWTDWENWAVNPDNDNAAPLSCAQCRHLMSSSLCGCKHPACDLPTRASQEPLLTLANMTSQTPPKWTPVSYDFFHGVGIPPTLGELVMPDELVPALRLRAGFDSEESLFLCCQCRDLRIDTIRDFVERLMQEPPNGLPGWVNDIFAADRANPHTRRTFLVLAHDFERHVNRGLSWICRDCDVSPADWIRYNWYGTTGAVGISFKRGEPYRLHARVPPLPSNYSPPNYCLDLDVDLD
ncbi:hypothetical protein QBC34DRAFT_382782 [Podospora aff. communis PSN243]|uniref:RING-type domain-containing protein n=1 Tax=Podospora aff. communis PSN243 TaxID=3040156 RepID=A0AAV9GEV7_9PEZI|nr:hypothetical protein QBC34DRAFT_382782 [Podospora aff. communis PSN243]